MFSHFSVHVAGFCSNLPKGLVLGGRLGGNYEKAQAPVWISYDLRAYAVIRLAGGCRMITSRLITHRLIAHRIEKIMKCSSNNLTGAGHAGTLTALTLVAMSALFCVGCGSSAPATPDTGGNAQGTVFTITSRGVSPKSITVTPGTCDFHQQRHGRPPDTDPSHHMDAQSSTAGA